MSKAIGDLDFVQRTRWPALGWTLLLVALCALAVCGGLWRAQEREREALRDHIDRLQGRAATGQARGDSAMQAADPRTAPIERLLLRPWDRLFSAIEDSRIEDVELLSLEPDADSGTIVIIGIANRFDNLTTYVDRLSGTSLTDVTLVAHQKAPELPNQPLRFTLSARWDQALP